LDREILYGLRTSVTLALKRRHGVGERGEKLKATLEKFASYLLALKPYDLASQPDLQETNKQSRGDRS
jgi:hypothetical protein